MTSTKRLLAASVVVLATLVASGCSNVAETQDGPLVFGAATTEPEFTACVAEITEGESAWFGERATNKSDEDVTILSVVPMGVSDVVVGDIEGRAMAADDPHFLTASDDEISDPQFAPSFDGLQNIEGIVLAPGEALGVVVQLSPDEGAKTGQVQQLRMTYEAGGAEYASLSAVTLAIASGECG